MLFDSHAHLDDKQFNKDREEIINGLTDFDVSCVLNISADIASGRKSIEIAEQYGFIYSSVGVHPHYAKDMTDESIAELRKMAAHPKVVAIGEIGLDYYYKNSDAEVQKEYFRKQLDLANELDLPVIIHNRDAHQDTLEILKEKNTNSGVVHCYSGSADLAKILLGLGLYISFTGVITFSNAKTAIEALKVVPMDKLLIETDCPYLAPEPFRGKRNQSGYVKFVAEKVAEIKGMEYEEVARITTENTKRLFNID